MTISIAELCERAGVDEMTLRARLHSAGLLSGQGSNWEAQVKALVARMREERSTDHV
jgi:hypothetical protein